MIPESNPTPALRGEVGFVVGASVQRREGDVWGGEVVDAAVNEKPSGLSGSLGSECRSVLWSRGSRVYLQ